MKKLFILSLAFSLSLTSLSAQEKGKAKAYVVADAHLDTQWNWDLQTTIKEYIPNTINQNLFLLKRYPSYVFNFEGGIKYAWMKEYYPDKYEEVKEYIHQGRWHLAGASWEANEVLISSTESLIRNTLLGQTFYKEEFGMKSDDIFLPDCFGFGWTLPAIANHCGLIGFSTQKLQWRSSSLREGLGQYPFTIGLWQGIDGSRIMAAANGFGYGDTFPDTDISYYNHLKDLAGWSPTNTVYHYYGTGDIGGSPTIESVSAVEKGVKGTGPVTIISATSSQLYSDYLPFDSHPELPVFDGEMLMDVHGNGCYTSQTAMKLYNRQNELLGTAAERAAVMADWMNPGTYPLQDLTESWRRFIFHQFHDDLTGTSIPRAYEFSWNDELISLSRFAGVLNSSVGMVSERLDTRVKGTPVVIYNPASFEVNETLELTLPMAKEPRSVVVFNEKGKTVPAQKLAYKDGQITLLLTAQLPSLGVAVYDVQASNKNEQESTFSVSEKVLENSVYKLTLDSNGDIASIIDKRTERELIQAGKSIRLALFPNNRSFAWPAWEITREVINSQPVSVNSNVQIKLVENGPVRTALCVERKYGNSVFKQYIRLTNGEQKDRIDIYNEVDWHSQTALLKAEFPLSVSNEMALYDVGLGAVERATNNDRAYETYAHHWADLSDTNGQYGVTILNNARYGWDKPDANTLRLTLLHTPQTESAFLYQDKQDLGHHVFTYSIIGHEGKCPVAEMARKGETLNQTLKVYTTTKHKGELGRSLSFANVDNEGVMIKALKKAEDGQDEYIVRVYETAGKGAKNVSLSFITNILAAQEANGIEEAISPMPVTNGKLMFDITPYSMKTMRVKLQAPSGLKARTADMRFVDIKYDVQTTTHNEFRLTADFDGRGHTYAAELLPDTLNSDGILFRLGDKTKVNALRCKSDTLFLPQDGSYNTLHLLMSSTLGDYKGTFQVGKTKHELVVPYYSGFYGQWGHEGHTEGYLKEADLAYIGTHRHSMVGNCDKAYEYTYLFKYKLNIGKDDKYLIVPQNTRIVLFAATLGRENTTLTAAAPLFETSLKENTFAPIEFPTVNLALGKKVIASSGRTSEGDRPESMIDGNPHTKWADWNKGIPNYVDIDLGAVQTIKAWRVLHEGPTASYSITREFALLGKAALDGEWMVLDSVSNNVKEVTDHNLDKPVDVRYVRLQVVKPVRDGGDLVRIHEFEVY